MPPEVGPELGDMAVTAGAGGAGVGGGGGDDLATMTVTLPYAVTFLPPLLVLTQVFMPSLARLTSLL